MPLAPESLHEVRRRVGLLVPYAEGTPGSIAKAVRKEDGIGRGGSLAALQQIPVHARVVTTQRYPRLSDDAVRREAGRLHVALQ